jgi:hypothetical protein
VKYDLIYYFTIYLGIPLDKPISYNDYFFSPKFREYFRWDDYLKSYIIKVNQPRDLKPNSNGLVQKLNYKFHKEYPLVASCNIKKLLCKMINYDYYQRVKASDILKNPIFIEIKY